MNVAQLIKELQKQDQDLEVRYYNGEWTFSVGDVFPSFEKNRVPVNLDICSNIKHLNKVCILTYK